MQGEVSFLKFGGQICKTILNLHMKCRTTQRQTRSLWTWPCEAKPWPASPNHHV